MILGLEFAITFFVSGVNRIILSVLICPSFFLLIKNMAICSKNDTHEKGWLLFFLNIFYSPFYSISVLKKRWIY